MAKLTTYWTALPINAGPVPPRHVWHLSVVPNLAFRVRYLILLDDGFLIYSASVENREFIHDIWSDVFLVPEWDRLERLGQLDRVRLDARVEVGGAVILRVQNMYSVDRPLRGAVIGEEFDESWPPSIPYLDDEPIPPTQPSPPPKQTPVPSLAPVAQECRDCGAPIGCPCHGVRRGEFHASREGKKVPSLRSALPERERHTDYWLTLPRPASVGRP